MNHHIPHVLEGSKGAYTVVKHLGRSGNGANLYQCACSSAQAKDFMLKIGASAETNPVLDREALLLRELRQFAFDVEQQYAAERGSQGCLHYHLGFPELVETFISREQGNRRVIILGFDVADELRQLTPLSFVVRRECSRIDMRTSAWILGKLLKIVSFAHSQHISVGNLSVNNVLMERDEHCVLVFDWSQAIRHEGGLPCEVARNEIALAAICTLYVLGDAELDVAEKMEGDAGIWYRDLVRKLATGGETNASQAHKRFYEVVESLWGRVFHPYTSFPLVHADSEEE